MNEPQKTRAALQLLSGRSAGKTVRLERGTRLRVGQSARAEWAIVGDETLGAIHFFVDWNGETCTITPAPGMQVVLNNKTIDGPTLADHGAVLLAGQTSFLLRLTRADLRAHLPPAPPDARADSTSLAITRAQTLALLQNETRLFVLLDAARDRRISALLTAADETYESLFEGPKGRHLAQVAPYLVELSPQSELLDVLVQDGWGESWGVYIVGLRPFKEIRRRLRRLLMVQDEETNKKLYFRFYDPRVLRAFWPACSVRQRSEMLGSEIAQFILEGPDDELMRLTQ